MQKCWHSDSKQRPTAIELSQKIYEIRRKEAYSANQTKIINSPDIGPITNNLDAIFKSRSLSAMIKSAEFTRSITTLGISK